jgi:hypothetical protein
MLVRRLSIRVFAAAAIALLPAAASADLLQSTHFRLDPNVAGTFGGSMGSASYQLQDVGGEGVVGAGSSQSYKLGQGYARQLPHAIELTVLPSGTYAYWPMDTGTGTQAYDLSATGDDATLVNTPSWATGIIGQAVALNGSTQYLTTGKQLAGPTAFTLEFWFKSTSNAGGYLMGFGDAATGASTSLDRLVYLRSDGRLTFGTKAGASPATVTTASGYNDGSWHHVAASLGSGGLLLYVDGLRQATDNATTTAGSYSGYWRLGFDNLAGWPGAPTSNYAAATVDEARVLTRQLRDADITNDYTAGANALASAFTLPNITPGTSQTYAVDATVRTDAGGYDLYLQLPQPLSRVGGGATFPNITASIAGPAAWTEGTTKGLGFTLTGGTNLEAKWGSNPNYHYAALPADATTYHSRIGLTTGLPETTTVQYRADAATSQQQGTYSATVVYTATLKP